MSVQFAIPAAETPAANGHGEAHSTATFRALMLGSIGVVYGDIGTSPLYALREAVVAASGTSAAADAAGRARRALADPVGADRGGDAEIRRHPAARRQQRRGRNAGADGAGAARGRQGRGCDRAARHHLRRAVLWRRGHHAGAVGIVGDRRHQARHRHLRTLCRAADGDHSGGAVCRAVPRHRARRRVLRTGHVRLVRRHRDRGRAADRAASRSAAGAQPAPCRLLHAPSRHDRLRDAGRGVSRRHRRGGALCRPRPFRQAADPDRVALHRAAVAGDELSGAGRAPDRRSQGDREPVLPDVPGLGADPDGGAGDGGDRDCEPGRHHRRLFADASGDPARPAAAVRNSSYVGSPFRPDLHSRASTCCCSLR